MADNKIDRWVNQYDFSKPENVKRTFKKAFDNERDGYLEWVGMPKLKDADLRRYTRRMETSLKNVQYAREMIGDDYPDYPGTSYFEMDWAFLNSIISDGYDAIDQKYDLIFAAAIWILDMLYEGKYLYDAVEEILPELSEADAEDIPSWMTAEDSVFSEALVMKTVYVLIHRNDDCKVYKTKGEEKRNFLDEVTARGKNMQDVPSRNRFEKLIALITEEAIEEAVKEFKEKYWFLARAFFFGLQKNHAKRDELLKSHDRLEEKICSISDGSRKVTIEINKDNIMTGPDRFKVPDSFRKVVELDRALERCSDQVEEGVEEKQDYSYLFKEYLSMIPANREDFMSAELNERMKDFRIENPYRMAFALLYLADRNDDLIWMHFFGTALASMIADSLPWRYGFDDYILDDLRERYPDPEPVSPVPDLYETRFCISDPEAYTEQKNLSQLIFEMTGIIPPRNLDQFDVLEEYWNDHGVSSGEQVLLKMCMSILYSERKYIGTYHEEVQTEEKAEQSAGDQKELITSLQKQITSLSKENKSLKEAVWKAQNQNARLSEKAEQAYLDAKADREELAALREMLFLDQNPEQEVPDQNIQFPYKTEDRIVICGGHDTFIKQIAQLITGNIRYLNNVRINEDLIRNAAMIWIQTNAIGHSDYYKIVDLCRKNNKTVHYFRYASARKCAEQIVKERTDK